MSQKEYSNELVISVSNQIKIQQAKLCHSYRGKSVYSQSDTLTFEGAWIEIFWGPFKWYEGLG